MEIVQGKRGKNCQGGKFCRVVQGEFSGWVLPRQKIVWGTGQHLWDDDVQEVLVVVASS